MKKMFLFLLFALPVLRGINLVAQTCDSIGFTTNYNSCNNAAATLSIVHQATGGVTYTFSLDSVASPTATWQNVMPGYHTLSYRGSNGCTGSSTRVYLHSTSSYSIFTEQLPASSCRDTLLSFKLTAAGGQTPYTFNFDRGVVVTNGIAALKEYFTYKVAVTDARGCRIDSIDVSILYKRDSINMLTSFAHNVLCSDTNTLGTLMVSIPDPRPVRPLSISIWGSPFTTDTVFRNTYNGWLQVTVRSATGCLYRKNVYHYPSAGPYITMSDSCANRFGRGTIRASVSGSGAFPYRYSWNNSSTTLNLTDVPIGTYSLTVTDANGCVSTASKTLTTCVWSGDTDTSGLVNASDLLNIGLAFGERGRARNTYCQVDSPHVRLLCTNWQPNNVPFWSKQTPTNVNLKHADASGDGVINHADTFAVTRNWNKTRSLRSSTSNPLEVRGAAPPIFVQTGNVAEGKWTAFPIVLGDATNSATGVYGLAFSVNYDPSVIDASSVYISFGQNWLGSGDNVLRVFKNFDGVVEVGISRINQQNSNGNGQIATLHFKTKTGTFGRNLAFSINNQQVINRDAQNVPTVATPTQTTVLTATAEPEWATQIEIYPNPTTENTIVEAQNLTIQSIEVFDISGKSLFKTSNFGKKGPLSIERAGTYFLKIQTEKGVLMRKVVRL